MPGMAGLARELDALELAALQWRWCVEAACQAGRELPADRYLEVRLEAFSPSTLERIMAFCGLSLNAAVTERFECHWRPGDPSGRRTRADAAELERVRRWIEPTEHWLESNAPLESEG